MSLKSKRAPILRTRTRRPWKSLWVQRTRLEAYPKYTGQVSGKPIVLPMDLDLRAQRYERLTHLQPKMAMLYQEGANIFGDLHLERSELPGVQIAGLPVYTSHLCPPDTIYFLNPDLYVLGRLQWGDEEC